MSRFGFEGTVAVDPSTGDLFYVTRDSALSLTIEYLTGSTTGQSMVIPIAMIAECTDPVGLVWGTSGVVGFCPASQARPAY